MGEGDDRARAVDHEDQGRRAPGAQVLRVDWRLHPRLALDVPADVDLEAGVRRVWALDRAPQVLLSARRAVGWGELLLPHFNFQPTRASRRRARRGRRA